jgi:hypothetical protein
MLTLVCYGVLAVAIVSWLIVAMVRNDRANRAAEAESLPRRIAAAKRRRQMVANWFRRAQLPG